MANIGCSKQEMYTGARIEWRDLYPSRWKDFNDYSPVFTEGFGKERIAEIDAIARMPDKASRMALSVATTKELEAAQKDVLHNYLYFKSYVQTIYDPSVHDLKLSAIGNGYYVKAAKKGWGDTLSLLDQAIPYLENNLKELMAKNIIPASFPDRFKAVAKTYQEKHGEFYAIDQTVSNLNNEKNKGDDAIFGHIVNLNRVAQIIYRNDPKEADSFVWSTILSQIQGVKNAGASGKVTIDGTKDKRLAEVKVTIVETDETTLTDKNGQYSFTPLGKDVYTFIFEKEGYETQTVEVTINMGTTSRVNVVMKAIATVQKV